MKNRLPSFIKLQQNKRFNMKTRYYDADKEEIRNRIAAVEAEIKHENSLKNKEVTRYKLEQEWKLNRTRQGHFDRSNMRIALITAVLAAVSYYLFFL